MSASTAIIGRIAVKVTPDTSDFRRDLERSLTVLEKSLRINIQTTANMTGAKRSLIEGVRVINAENKVGSAATIRLQAEVSSASLAAAAAEVEQFHQRVSPVKVDVDVDRSLSDRITAPFRSLTGVIGGILGTLPRLGVALMGVAGVSAVALSSVSSLATLSVSLAQLGGLLPVLPGLYGGVAIGIGTMVAALKDFNDVFPDVKAKLSALQDLISTKFWAQAKAPIRDLIDTVLPELTKGFGNTATALGGYFAGLAAGVKGTLVTELKGMFGDLSASIRIATGGTGALVGIITTLGTVGAGYLPQLATWFVQITKMFDVLLTRAATDGSLSRWVDMGLQALKDLWSVLVSVGSILVGVAQAATDAGGSSLSVLAEGLRGVAAVVNSPAFQTGLVSVFVAAHEAMRNIAAVSGPAVAALFASLGSTLAQVLPLAGLAIGTLVSSVATALASPALQSGLVGLFTSLSAAVLSLAPAFGPVSAAIAALLPVVGSLMTSLAPVVTVVLTGLSQVIVDLAPQVQALAGWLGGALLTAVNALVPIITGFTGFLSEHTTTFEVLAGIIGGVVVASYVAMGIAAAANAALAVISFITVAVTGEAVAKRQEVTGATIVAGWVLMGAQATLNAAKVAAAWLLSAITSAATAVASMAVAVASIVAGWVLMGVQSMLAAAKIAAAWLISMGPIALIVAAVIALVVVIVKNWDAIKNAITTAASYVLDFLKTHWPLILGILIGPFGLAVALIVTHWSKITSLFSTGIAAIKGFFSGAETWLLDAGAKIISGLLHGITDGFQKVKDKLSELTSLLPDWKGPAPVDKVLLFNAGSLIIGGLIDGMESQYKGVHKSLAGLTGDIGNTMISAPQATGVGASMAKSLAGSESGPNVVVQKTLVYNAAPGSSLGAEEDLFSASARTRMVGW